MTSKLGWQVDLDALVQIDAVPYSQASIDDLDPATHEPLNAKTVDVRRALLRAQGHKDQVFAALELEASNVAGPTSRLLGAVVGWSLPGLEPRDPPLLTLTTGLILIPFGTEVPTNVRDKTFLELPTWATAMFPGSYDGGVSARGAFHAARWVVALMDGAPSGDAQWKGRDPTASYDLIARLGGAIDLPTLAGRPAIDFGVSALTGTGLHPGTAPTKDQIQWVDEDGNGIVSITEIHVISGSPGSPSLTFKHSALGADAAVRWCLQELGRGTAFGELAIGTNLDRGVLYADPIQTLRNMRELGFTAGVLQDATPWAQVGVRYDRYDADRDAQQQDGVSVVRTHVVFSTLAVLAAARWGTSKLILEYDHRHNPLGRDDTGAPATRADDRLALRAEAKF